MARFSPLPLGACLPVFDPLPEILIGCCQFGSLFCVAEPSL